MKAGKLTGQIRAAVLAAAVFLSAMPFTAHYPVYAEEVTDEAAVAEEGAADAAAEGEAAADGAVEGAEGEVLPDDAAALTGGTGVTPGTILANNGLYIANTFPDSLMPVGFHRQTVAYQGQNIDLAYMDNSDQVVLAYLTDMTGAVGDFYLCDTATATMSDYIRLEGGNGTFLIILDPGDNINGPVGFTKTMATINNKSITAWALPNGNASTGEEDKEARLSFGETVYAADLGIGIGAGGGDSAAAAGDAAAGTAGDGTATVIDNSYTDGTTVDPAAAGGTAADATAAAAAGDYAAAAAAEVAAANVVTDAAGFVKAQPSEFYLVYGVDYNGAQGFFLYDTLGQTYQRYVEIDMGESEETAKYRKSAQIRLFIIAGLILFAVVLIFLIINMSLGGKKGSRNYDDDDVEEVKRRVKSKEKRQGAGPVSAGNGGRRYQGGADFEDEYDETFDDEGPNDDYDDGAYGRQNMQGGGFAGEEDDVRYYDRQAQHTGRGVVRKGAVKPPASDDRSRKVRTGTRVPDRQEMGGSPRPKVRTEARPKVRTERRYVPQPGEDMGYGVGQETADMNWEGNMDGGADYGPMDNNIYANNPGVPGQQDIDLDDDFNFDFIKPGK